VLVELLAELSEYPAKREKSSQSTLDRTVAEMVVPFQLSTKAGVLTFFSTTMVFGTPVDITLSELAVESFFPADTKTGERLRMLVEA